MGTLLKFGLVLFAIFYAVGWLQEHGYWAAIEKAMHR